MPRLPTIPGSSAVLLAILLAVRGVVAGDALPEGAEGEATATDSSADEQDDEEGDGSLDEWDESVSVVARIGGATSAPKGASSSVLAPNALSGSASTLTGVVADAPGVSENGQGGLFQVFSVRGVSRQRVLSLVSGMQIHSERRAGASVSFIDPLLMDSVEVVRGPATTLHGSGALGGVVQVFPRVFSEPSLQAGYHSQGNEEYQVVGIGDAGWSAGLARRVARDAESASGERLHSGFTQYSATLARRWERGPRTYDVLLIPTLGEDIAKANSDFPERTTNYPEERHQLLRLAVASRAGWRLQTHLHAHDLETDVVDMDVDEPSRNRVFNDSLDSGASWSHEIDIRSGTSLTWGLQVAGRNGVDADETRQSLDPADPGRIEILHTLDGARQLESGAFVTLSTAWGPTELETGVRGSWMRQKNRGAATRSDAALNGFVGAVRRFRHPVELRGSVSSGVRFPSLSELFFSGTTGAGGVIGNPDLDRERSLNFEVSARWLGRRMLVHGALFHNDIDDYVERVGDEQKTFVNLGSGTIRGLEVQALVRPATGWILDLGGHVITGRDDADDPLADVPPDQVHVGFGHDLGAWRFDSRLTHRARKSDAGTGEQPIPSAELLHVGLHRTLPGGWSMSLSGRNLLDERFFRSTDDQASPAPGRSFGLHLTHTGG